jgi:hypothetical protein
MSPGAVVMTVRAESELAALIFAAAVDHARACLPDLQLVLVDDCSPHPRMLRQLEQWDRARGITVIRMGPPVASGFYARVGITAGEPTSFGHAPSLDRGLWYVWHHLKATWAFVLDGDVILLDPHMAKHVEAAVALLDDQTVAVGEWVGTPKAWQEPHTVDALWHCHGAYRQDKAAEPVEAAIRAYGYVNMMCSVVNLQLFWHPLVQSLQNTGWVANQWFYAQMAIGHKAAYYPFFRNESAAHIGAVAVATTQGESFGNIEGGRHYGQRGSGNYYAGYLQVVNMTVFAQALAHRGGRLLDAHDTFAPAPLVVPQGPPRYLRYGILHAARLYDDQAIDFEWVERESGQVLATVETDLFGAHCRIDNVKGETPEVEREAYEAVFEHSPALQRTRVWTPDALIARLDLTREVHDHDGPWSLFFWRYFGRGVPQWRWAERYGWGRSLTGPLEVPTR